MKQLKTLYKRNANGSINQWSIIVENNVYWSEYGQVGGVIVKTVPIEASPKNIGKRNETSAEEQAYKEALSIWKLKKKSENFVESIEDVDKKLFEPPMLANKFEGNFNSSFHKFVQPKLDGIRMNVSFNPITQQIEAISRRNNKFYTVQHIINVLKEFFRKNPTIHLDGELYNHKFHDDFNTITSLVKKEKITKENEDEIVKYVRYNIYDCWDESNPNLIFSERLKILDQLSDEPFIDIVSTYAVKSKEELDDLYNHFVSIGYEGAIIRADKPYEHKRSKNLLKYKSFYDDEFTVIDICEGKGNWSGVAGYVVIDLGDGKTCKSNIKGDMLYCKELLDNKEKYIGKKATITYFEKTPDGSLRFPYLKTFRDYE